MIIVYCKACLPTKHIMGYSNKFQEANIPHEVHTPLQQNGRFGVSVKDWKGVFVQGDDATTKANIIATFGDQMVP